MAWLFWTFRIWFGRNYFRVKLIPPIQKKIGWFYWRARFHQGQPDAATGEGSKNMIVDPCQWVHMSGNTYSGTCTYGYTFNMNALCLPVHTVYNYNRSWIEHEKFPITMIKWLLIFDFVQLLNTFISFLDRIHVSLASSERNEHVALIFIAK